jgi:hypothetical protein
VRDRAGDITFDGGRRGETPQRSPVNSGGTRTTRNTNWLTNEPGARRSKTMRRRTKDGCSPDREPLAARGACDGQRDSDETTFATTATVIGDTSTTILDDNGETTTTPR